MYLQDKVALITGGSSGIGRATALAFAQKGAKVVIAARGGERGAKVAQEIKAAGGEACFVTTDVSKANEVKALVRRTVEMYGRLDCAFNNAFYCEGALSLTADFSEEEFDETIGVNLKGVWLCMKYEIQEMLRQDPVGGAIVNASSINGLGGAPQFALYSATKAGILALTKSAAQEYASKGIRINALVPGPIDTPALQRTLEGYSDGDPKQMKRVKAEYNRWPALRRIGKPEEAAEAVIWLCSEAASFVVGHSMIVDGGISASMR